MSDETINFIDEEIEAFLKSYPEDIQLDRFHALEFTHSDADVMRDLSVKLSANKNVINDAFAGYMHSAYQTVLSSDPSESTYWVNEQISNFHILLDGNYDKAYARKCIAVGLIHRKLEQPFNLLIACYSKYKALIEPFIVDACKGNIYGLARYMGALSKIIYFDLGIELDAYCYGDKSAFTQIQHEVSSHMGQLLASTEQLLYQKNHDSLTGMPNRHSFKKQLTHFLQFADDKATSVALIKLGLDHFKLLNDLEGYDTGDQVLKEIAIRLQGYLHKDDLIAYWGGDTFTIALNNVDQTNKIDRVCHEISQLIREPYQVKNKKLPVTCSMGIALYPQDCADIDSLIKYSDNSMNLAKEMGGGKFQFFNAELDERLAKHNAIANELYSAIEGNQFCLYYQPVADLQTGEIISMEALVRWMHPERGLVPPNEFIAIAEELSIINKLGDWIIRQACQDLKAWQNQGVCVPRIAINVSPKQLLDPLFAKNLLLTLNEWEINPNLITLEITESLLMNHSDAMKILLNEFKTQGFYLAMDDFGTGYSALQYLKHYPFNYVKIDRSFVTNIVENPGDAAIANAVISMAHSMGIKVIAEGVETEAQCQFLSQNMCDQIQGYFLSHPMPHQQAGDYISKKITVPEHLLRVAKINRTLLLVDDEPNILSALKRLFRKDGYTVLTANSGPEGLETLKEHNVDIIVSDQRMPAMTGVEFLRQAKEKYPNTIRIVLSGYTELQSITDAINEGSIYKFLTKPWDDQQLSTQISEAFIQKEMFDENRKLELKIQTTNQELASANRQLADLLQSKEKQLLRDEISLDIAREALQHIPIPILGIDEDGMIAFANFATEALLFKDGATLGMHIEEVLPNFNSIAQQAKENTNFSLNIPDFNYLVNWRIMGAHSKSKGKLITFLKIND